MLNMLGIKTKRDKMTLLKGVAIGVFAGAFLPDKYNPVVVVKSVLGKGGF